MSLTSLLCKAARLSATRRALRRGPKATAKRALRIGIGPDWPRMGPLQRPTLATLN